MDDTGQARIAHLNRLGLVRFAAEPVADYCRYALLQVQPRSLEAMESTKRTSSIYRSICLSVLGNSSAPAVSTSPATCGGGWDTNPRRKEIIGKGPPPRR